MADNNSTETQQSGQTQSTTPSENLRDFQRVDTTSNSTIRKGEDSKPISTKVEKENK